MRAGADARQRLGIILSAISVGGYLIFMMLMAFAPDWLARSTGGGAVNRGLYWGFAYAMLTIALMVIFVWRRTHEGRGNGDAS